MLPGPNILVRLALALPPERRKMQTGGMECVDQQAALAA